MEATAYTSMRLAGASARFAASLEVQVPPVTWASAVRAIPEAICALPWGEWVTGARVAAVVGGGVCAVWCWRQRGVWMPQISHVWKGASSWVIWQTRSVRNKGVRNGFKHQFSLLPGTMHSAHPHPVAAADRNYADAAISSWIVSMGFEVYELYGNTRSRPVGIREYHTFKDLDQDFYSKPVKSNHILKAVDVDYYLDDIEYWLAHGQPLVLYTFVPKEVSGVVPNGHFTIDRNDVVTTTINGSCGYKHKIWDWDTDHLIIPTWFGCYKCSVDAVQMPGDPNRRIVCVIPQVWIPDPLSWLLQGTRLKRVKYNHGPYNALQTMDRDGNPYISVGQPGETFSVKVQQAVYSSLGIRLKAATRPTIADVERMLTVGQNAIMTYEEARKVSPLLYAIIKDDPKLSVTASWGPVPARLPTDHVVQHLHPHHPLDDRNVTGRVVGPALVTHGAVGAARTVAAEAVSIQQRVDNVRNTTEPPGWMRQWADDFVRELVPDELMGKGVPYDFDYVMLQQDKPAQKQRSERAHPFMTNEDASSPLIVRSFLKKEVTTNAGAPRNISTLPTNHIIRLSAYTYAFKDCILKNHKWYVPGSTPVEVAERVMDEAHRSPEGLVCTDYSKMDGTISTWLRLHVERAVYLRYFGHDEPLADMLRGEINTCCFTHNGIKYDAGASRLSGSPLTTDGNTIINAFVAYTALRKLGHDKGSAFMRIGCMYGDDGVQGGVQAAVLNECAAALGLRLKSDERALGQPVPFLGRIFLDPWHCPYSIQDPMRTIARLHISATSPEQCTPEQALVNKCFGYSVTDSRTPIIGAYCAKVLELVKPEAPSRAQAEYLHADLNWWAQVDPDPINQWPQDPCDELPRKVVAEALGIAPADVADIDARIRAATSLDQFPTDIVEAHPEFSVPAVYQGQIHGSETASQPSEAGDVIRTREFVPTGTSSSEPNRLLADRPRGARRRTPPLGVTRSAE